MIPYIILSAVIFGINTIPALMPPTWALLVFFHFHYNLSFIPTIVLGAFSATAGRILLAYLSRTFLRPHLSKKVKDNYKYLGKFINSHKHLTVPIIILYAFLPIPSNQIYIAAGLAEANIWLIASSFLIGRLISYTFWVGAAHALYGGIEDVFTKYYSNSNFYIAEVAGILVLIVISMIPWKKTLVKLVKLHQG